MANVIVPNTNSQVTLSNDFDFYYVPAANSVIVASTEAVVIDVVTFPRLVNDGTIASVGSTGVLVGGNLTTIINGANGVISGGTGVFYIGAPTNSHVLTNAGQISATLTGIDLLTIGSPGRDQGEIVLNNSGIIQAGVAGIEARFHADIINTGSIDAGLVGVVLDWPAFGSTLTNSGDIIAAEIGVHMVQGLPSLTNTGFISGAIGVKGDSEGYVTNDGIIATTQVSGFAVKFDDGNNIFSNTGTVLGRIQFGSGVDVVTNAGFLSGRVSLGDGDDIYRGVGAGLASDSVLGSDGDDRLFGASAADALYGEADDDLLQGRGGEDLLDGGPGNDTLRGGLGNDTLEGGDDDDRLFSNDGNDVLDGGLGKDVMRGGPGFDTFLFTAAADSGPGAAADRIRDFQPGEDLIDLTAIANFEFIGTSPFNGSGDAVVNIVQISSGLRVEMDVDGDGTADMRVNLNGVSALTEADFIL